MNIGNDKESHIGIRIDDETRQLIESQLEYGDSISGWVREAIVMRIDSEDIHEENRIPAAVTVN